MFVTANLDDLRIYDGMLTEDEVLALLNPVPDLKGDFNENGMWDANDIDLLTAAVNDENNNDPLFDVDGNNSVDSQDRTHWVKDIVGTYMGDSNLDGEFNSADLVGIFQAGEYEDDNEKNSGWASGDWNGDAEFDSGDLVLAFQDGGFEQGPREALATVPEPSGLGLLTIVLVLWPTFPSKPLCRRGR